jgi:hypothetical protein
VRRVRAGFSVCLGAGLLALVAAPASGSSLTKHCTGKAVAVRPGVRLVAGHISITATAYNPYTVQDRSVRPTLACRRARIVLHDFLLAKLTRPLRQCTVRVLRGGGCKVGNWLCYENEFAPPAPRGSFDELCTHLVLDRHRVVRRLTHIFFRETDHGHARDRAHRANSAHGDRRRG